MKLIFLDIDGVLATQATRYNYLDVECVARLDRVLEATGAQIILSSTWRLGLDVSECQAMLRRGHSRDMDYDVPDNLLYVDREKYEASAKKQNNVLLASRLIDKTAWMRYQDASPVDRGMEIDAKVKQYNPDVFVILDDDLDMEPHMDRLIKTDPYRGFGDADAKKTIQMLGVISETIKESG